MAQRLDPRSLEEILAQDHKDHQGDAMRGARILASSELEGNHRETLLAVYRFDSAECWQCVVVELLKLMRDPLDSQQLAEEVDDLRTQFFTDLLAARREGESA